MSADLDPRLDFDRFVVGPGNRIAAAAARHAAEAPGRSYNPLVLVGADGVGKTHLLHAVAHLARAIDPELAVRYETAQELVDRVSGALASGTLDTLREATAGVGLWLLDDLHEISGRGRTQDELLALWDALLERGAQLLVTLDRAPATVDGLDPRLIARLGAGLSVEIGPPHEEADFTAPPPAADEFGGFLADISTAVAAVVETAPWKRRLAEAILRWEGEGIRARRLEEALDADSAPDVEALLHSFAHDVERMRELAALLPEPPEDAVLVRDPDRLPELERLAASYRLPATSHPLPAGSWQLVAGSPQPEAPIELDPWFLDGDRFDWEWVSLEERLIEEQR